MNFWFTYLAKSIYAALVAVSSGVVLALRNGDSTIGGYEWLIIVLAGLIAGVGVFALPPKTDSPAVQRAQAAAEMASSHHHTPQPEE